MGDFLGRYAYLWILAIVLIPNGCRTPGTEVTQTPEATAEPRIEAKELRDINQSIKQLQTTVSSVEHSFALDTERAALKRQEMRDTARRTTFTTLQFVGGLICALLLKLDVGPKYKSILLFSGLACILSPFPFILWPW